MKFAFALCVIKEGKLFLEIEHRMIRQILCGDFGGKFAPRPFFIKADIIGDERFDGVSRMNVITLRYIFKNASTRSGYWMAYS